MWTSGLTTNVLSACFLNWTLVTGLLVRIRRREKVARHFFKLFKSIAYMYVRLSRCFAKEILKSFFSCASYVGLIKKGGQKLTVGPSCKLGNIIHEIGHAIGFYHEMARPDRDKYVKVKWENIMESMVTFQCIFCYFYSTYIPEKNKRKCS